MTIYISRDRKSLFMFTGGRQDAVGQKPGPAKRNRKFAGCEKMDGPCF